MVEIRIYSSRNQKISTIREISPYHPNPEEQIKRDEPYNREVWYPVVDIEIQRGMEGYAELFRITGESKYQQNGKVFIYRHIKFFERKDGLWNRSYNFNTKK